MENEIEVLNTAANEYLESLGDLMFTAPDILEAFKEGANFLHSLNRDFIIKVKAVLEYCEPEIDKVWAAKTASILLGCDFKYSKYHIKMFFDFCEKEGI